MERKTGNFSWERRTTAIGLSAGFGGIILVVLLLSLRLTAVAAPGQTTWYVHPDGSDENSGSLLLPFGTIQYAINVATDGDTILVAAGTYTENLSITETLTLRGGYTMSGTLWLPSTGETIVDGSGSQIVEGDWDGTSVHMSTVISADGMYKMWYAGWGLTSWGFGLATSPDGITWTKHAGNPVLTATMGWEQNSMGHPHVIKDGTTYKMWYGPSNGRIGYAESGDGISWTKYAANPILEGTPGTWEEKGIDAPFVIKVGPNDYRMWYNNADLDRVGYATSTNGITWTKYTSPVLSSGPDGAWDSHWAADPNLLLEGTTYHMWYAGFDGGAVRIGYASSNDGVNWNKSSSNPLLSPGAPGDWDDFGVSEPNVLFDGALYQMWFSGVREGWRPWQRGYATSTDGISWTKSLSNPVLSPGMPGHWGQPVVNIAAPTAGVTLDGFTITGGHGAEVGGVAAGGNVVIRNCIVRDNTAANEGWGGGGVLGYDGVLTIVDSLIVDNQFSGDGGAGGVRTGNSSLIMVNTVVANNHGDPGTDLPGVHANTDLALVNVTVANNDADIVFNPQPTATLTITNTIAYSHTGIYLTGCPSGSDCQVNYSNVQGWTGGGTGNISSDPQFVDAASDDYHLKLGSPCVDTGTTVGAPAADIEGTVRDATPDMGAYEWVGFHIYLPLIVRNF
jgi:predicted GH43/DUF377 family glycosyl hydrolase